MSPQQMIALRALIAISAAAVGGLLGMGRKRISHRVLCALVSVAAGALLQVTAVHIIPEMVEIVGVLHGGLTVIIGTLIFAAIGKYVYFVCPACAASATDDHGKSYLRLGYLLVIAMGIHSTVDGLAISAGSASVSAIGLLILFAVSYHKIPEGLALVSVARLAGYSRAKSLGITILVELTTALGAFVGLLFLHRMSEYWLGITLGVVAGSFIYTVGFAMLKEMYAHEKGSILLYAVLGFASMMAFSSILTSAGVHMH